MKGGRILDGDGPRSDQSVSGLGSSALTSFEIIEDDRVSASAYALSTVRGVASDNANSKEMELEMEMEINFDAAI
jgi:hypothetical protein